MVSARVSAAISRAASPKARKTNDRFRDTTGLPGSASAAFCSSSSARCGWPQYRACWPRCSSAPGWPGARLSTVSQPRAASSRRPACIALSAASTSAPSLGSAAGFIVMGGVLRPSRIASVSGCLATATVAGENILAHAVRGAMVWANMEIEERASHGDGQAQVALALRHEKAKGATRWRAAGSRAPRKPASRTPCACGGKSDGAPSHPPARGPEMSGRPPCAAMRKRPLSAPPSPARPGRAGALAPGAGFSRPSAAAGIVEGADALRLLAGPPAGGGVGWRGAAHGSGPGCGAGQFACVRSRRRASAAAKNLPALRSAIG